MRLPIIPIRAGFPVALLNLLGHIQHGFLHMLFFFGEITCAFCIVEVRLRGK